MRKATTADVAKIASVSRATVSYVLNNVEGKTISEETRNRVLCAARELDYMPNPFAKGLKTRTSKTVALILPTITDPSMPVLIKGVEVASNLNEYSLIIHDIESSEKDKLRGIEMLLEKAIDGIIYAYPDDSDEEIIKYLDNRRNIFTVVIGNKYQNHAIDGVRFDSSMAGEIMAQYLYDAGHRKIAVISGNLTNRRKQRIDGMNNFLKKYGLKAEVIIFKNNKPVKRSLFYDTREYEMGFELAIEILEKGLEYTAVVGINDMISIGVINALKSKGVLVPEDISIASFGGGFVTEIIEPKLTVVEQPSYNMGKAAFEVLMSKLEGHRNNSTQDIVFRPELIIRESTKRILKKV